MARKGCGEGCGHWGGGCSPERDLLLPEGGQGPSHSSRPSAVPCFHRSPLLSISRWHQALLRRGAPMPGSDGRAAWAGLGGVPGCPSPGPWVVQSQGERPSPCSGLPAARVTKTWHIQGGSCTPGTA